MFQPSNADTGSVSIKFTRLAVVAATIPLMVISVASVSANEHPIPTVSYSGWHKAAITSDPRWQWNANYGYCGETSFITAGLQFGQYASQWEARRRASPGVPQTSPDSQLLLGENDLATATAMRLDAVQAPPTRNFTTFTNWMKTHFMEGDVVIVGMYNNTRMLGENGPGDPIYDHIMPVYGWESKSPLTYPNGTVRPAAPSDVITVSDNGLRTVGVNAPMLYSYTLDDVQRTRQGANKAGGPVYSFPQKGPWYATAITGPADPTGVLHPVRLTVSENSEGLQNQSRMSAPPAPEPIVLTVHVPNAQSDLILYEYTSFDDVPVQDFNANASHSSRSWRIPAGSGDWATTVQASSSDTRVYRAVPADAP